MDPNTWVDTLYTYGPYAALALFTLYVAPTQTKTFLDCKADDRTKLAICGGIAALSWLIVVALIWFLLVSWPPKKVFVGDLGVHPAGSRFLAVSDDLYLGSKSHGTSGGDSDFQRLTWNYVIVLDQSAKSNAVFRFTYFYGAGELDYRDIKITRADLQQGRLDFEPGPTRGELRPTVAAQPTAASLLAARAHRTDLLRFGLPVAFADEPNLSALLAALDAADPAIRAQARARLADLPDETLRQLLSEPGLSALVRAQIERALQER